MVMFKEIMRMSALMIQLFEAPKEKGNKILDKINRKIHEIKMQQIFYIRKSRN